MTLRSFGSLLSLVEVFADRTLEFRRVFIINDTLCKNASGQVGRGVVLISSEKLVHIFSEGMMFFI